MRKQAKGARHKTELRLKPRPVSIIQEELIRNDKK